MAGPTVRSTLDVALWFLERAESAGGTLNPGKMHCLLYLAQARYAALNKGYKLMPATFVATGRGPLEPTVYHIFERGRPNLDAVYPSGQVESFLHEIWETYSARDVQEMRKRIEGDAAYTRSLEKGRNTEVDVRAMCLAYGGSLPGKGEDAPKPVEGDEPDTEYHTESGKTAVKWVPGMGRQY